MAYGMVCDPPKHLPIGLAGPDVQFLVHLHGVRIDDFTAETLSHGGGERAFSRRGWPADDDDRRPHVLVHGAEAAEAPVQLTFGNREYQRATVEARGWSRQPA